MEILFSTNLRAWGGGEKWMLTAATAMAQRGHGVTVAAPGGSEIARRAAAGGLPVLPVRYRGDLDLASWLSVFRHCRRARVDLLCCNMDRVLRVAGAAARVAGVPAVLPRRGSEFPLKDRPAYRFAYRQLATGMIVNSRATARTLTRGLDWEPAGRLHVLYNGLDCAPFRTGVDRAALRAELGVAAGATLLASVGELTTRKDHMCLVEALPRLVEQDGAVELVVVGEGPEREPLLHRARELGVADRLHLPGFRDDVPALLQASDLYVHPARLEGFGYAVAEAMAAQLACVVADASSLPEVIEDGRTGALFGVGDPAALAAACAPYLQDPARRAAHGAAGSRRVDQEFEQERQMDRLEAIFREEVQRPRN